MINRNLVLYADDDLDDRDIFAELFKDHKDLELQTFENGIALVDFLLQYWERVCYVILDQNMPPMSGIETLKLIRKQLPDFEIPITIYTTTIVTKDQAIYEAEGVSYLKKPTSMAAIKSCIDEIAAKCLD